MAMWWTGLIKEGSIEFHWSPPFSRQHAYTVTFYLNREEFELYKHSQLFSASRA